MLACAYFSITTVGLACPTTWRPPNRGEIDFCSRCALYAIWDLSPPFPATSFRSGCRTLVILCLRVCLVCVFLVSITTDSARLLSFRRPNGGDIVSFGFVQRVPPLLPPPIPSPSMHAGCRIVVILLFSLRLCSIDTHQGIGDMVILRLRVSLCCITVFYSGFYSELYV